MGTTLEQLGIESHEEERFVGEAEIALIKSCFGDDISFKGFKSGMWCNGLRVHSENSGYLIFLEPRFEIAMNDASRYYYKEVRKKFVDYDKGLAGFYWRKN